MFPRRVDSVVEEFGRHSESSASIVDETQGNTGVVSEMPFSEDNFEPFGVGEVRRVPEIGEAEWGVTFETAGYTPQDDRTRGREGDIVDYPYPMPVVVHCLCEGVKIREGYDLVCE
jgi:hypothetical protein